MHHSHGGSHGFWETFISLKFFRSKRGDEQYSYRHDRRRFGSGSGYEEHVDMRESTYDAFVRTPKETRSVPRRDKRERTKDKERKKDEKHRAKRKDHQHHQRQHHRPSSNQRRERHRTEKNDRHRHPREQRPRPRDRSPDTRWWDLPQRPERQAEPRSHRGPDLRRDRRASLPRHVEPTHRQEAVYENVHGKRDSPLSRFITTFSQQISSPASSSKRHRHHRRHRSPSPPPASTPLPARFPSPALSPPPTARRRTHHLHEQRTRAQEYHEGRDGSFDSRRRAEPPEHQVWRDDPWVVEPPVTNSSTEPKNLDEEIVIIEESDVDNHRNRSIPRGDPPQMEPLVYNVAIDPVGAEPLDLDEKPNEAFSQLRGGFRERHDNTSDSQDTPVASSKLPEPPPVAIEYTVGGPSAWEQLPESSKQILAHYVIPKSSSFVHWDGKSRPFNVWSSVFDASSLGDWIYGWAAQHYRPVPAPRHRTRSRAAWRGHREEERENAERARKLRAVYRFCETLAQLGRNVAEAEASMQTKSHDRPRMQRTPSMQRRYKKGKRRLGDGKEKLDDIEALVQVCQEAMVNEEIKEKYENIGGEEGRIPKLGESTMGAFIDALVGTEGFWEIEEAARAWNRWFRRWWRHESVMGGYYYDDNDEDEDYDILRGGPQV